MINKYKLVASVIMILTIILTIWIYGKEYSANDNPESLSETITEYIFNDDVNAQVVHIKKIGNRMLVSFTDNRYKDLIGLAVFKRGINFRWLPLRANFGSSITVKAFDYVVDDYCVICGINTDSNVVAYEFVTTDSNHRVLYANDVK